MEAPRPAWLDAELGVRVFARDLWFTDDLFQQLRPYRVIGVPALAGRVEVYPGALFSRGVASWFGLVVEGSVVPYLTSSDAEGRSYPTSVTRLTVGARGRYTVWRAELGLTLAYTRQSFTVDRSAVAEAPPEGLPNVTYESVHARVDGRLRITDRIGVRVRGGYLLPVAFGELGSDEFFPRASGGGVEAGAGATLSLTHGLEARLDFDWRRWFLSMNPQVGDHRVAGGAVDDDFATTLSLAYRR